MFTVRDENYHLLYFKFYRLPLYNEFLYNEDEEYGMEDSIWEDEGISGDENEAVNREEQIRNLYSSKTSDAKDDQAISSIIHKLKSFFKFSSRQKAGIDLERDIPEESLDYCYL